MLKTNWVRCIWAICIMTGEYLHPHPLSCFFLRWLMVGFNFFSHGSQDLYPVYLQTTKKFSSFDASKATIISNVGAIIGKIQSL